MHPDAKVYLYPKPLDFRKSIDGLADRPGRHLFVTIPRFRIGMEVCGGAHHWPRKLGGLGQDVRLMVPQFVKPYVKKKQNNVADAEAICVAVGRPSIRFVPIKDIEQQAVLPLHRIRQGFVKARTAQANQIRGLSAEFALVIPQDIAYLAKRLPEFIDDEHNELSGSSACATSTGTVEGVDHLIHETVNNIVAWRHANENY